MFSSLLEAFLLLVNAIVSFFCVLFLLRFTMQWRRVSFAGQLGEFVLKLTSWAVKPLRRVIPGLGGVDWASLFAVLLLQLAYVGLVFALVNPPAVNAPDVVLLLLLQTLRGFLRLIVYLVMGVVILDALLSWFGPYSPAAAPIRQLAQPILSPVRRVIPPISGIDLSPLIALVFLQMLLVFL
jgi:YggT family protein